MNDKTLTCKVCTSEFVFSVRDQQFYAEKGFENEPRGDRPASCRDCFTALAPAAATSY